MGYIKSFHQVSEVVPSESPLEGGGDALVVPLEAKESLLHIVQGEEVVGGENLTLNDREVDFDLVEPTCVDWAVHGHDVGEGRLKALDRGLSAMRGAVVHNPEHAASRAIRFLRHDLHDQTVEGFTLADQQAFSVQYHPEASPGPHDAHDIFFDAFLAVVDTAESSSEMVNAQTR